MKGEKRFTVFQTMTISVNDRVRDLNYIFPVLSTRARPSPTLGRRVFQTTALSVLKVPISSWWQLLVVVGSY